MECVCVCGGGHEKHVGKENNSVETDTRHSHSHLTEATDRATSHRDQQPKRIKKCTRDVRGGGLETERYQNKRSPEGRWCEARKMEEKVSVHNCRPWWLFRWKASIPGALTGGNGHLCLLLQVVWPGHTPPSWLERSVKACVCVSKETELTAGIV